MIKTENNDVFTPNVAFCTKYKYKKQANLPAFLIVEKLVSGVLDVSLCCCQTCNGYTEG